MSATLATLRDLSVTYRSDDGDRRAVASVDLNIQIWRAPCHHRRKRFGQEHPGAGLGRTSAGQRHDGGATGMAGDRSRA